MVVLGIEPHGFRNLAPGEIRLGERLTVVTGPNGAGKTNLLEALHFALTGRSCRTRREREMVAFGERLARVEAEVRIGGEAHRLLASVEAAPRGLRRRLVDGSATAARSPGDSRPPVAVFLPDRLALIKGPPGERRAHLDGLATALWPGRASARAGFNRALAQRNSLLARVRRGSATTSSLDPWDRELAREAMPLIAARRAAVERLADPFAASAAELGLPGEAALRYRPRSEAREAGELEREVRARRDLDLRRGHSTHGPHLDELELSLAGRSLRRYGSQGEQRAALLALILAERELLLEQRGTPPLMLLDDVMSELDPDRRELLVERLAGSGQALLTATHAGQLPDCEREELRLREGRAEEAGGAAARAAA